MVCSPLKENKHAATGMYFYGYGSVLLPPPPPKKKNKFPFAIMPYYGTTTLYFLVAVITLIHLEAKQGPKKHMEYACMCKYPRIEEKMLKILVVKEIATRKMVWKGYQAPIIFHYLSKPYDNLFQKNKKTMGYFGIKLYTMQDVFNNLKTLWERTLWR